MENADPGGDLISSTSGFLARGVVLLVAPFGTKYCSSLPRCGDVAEYHCNDFGPECTATSPTRHPIPEKSLRPNHRNSRRVRPNLFTPEESTALGISSRVVSSLTVDHARLLGQSFLSR